MSWAGAPSDLGLPLLEAVDADPVPGLLDEDIRRRRHSPRGRESKVDVLQVHDLRTAPRIDGGEERARVKRG